MDQKQTQCPWCFKHVEVSPLTVEQKRMLKISELGTAYQCPRPECKRVFFSPPKHARILTDENFNTARV